jgi:signal transduction histidine kinase
MIAAHQNDSDRASAGLMVLGPLAGRLSIEGSALPIDCRPFEVSTDGIGIWTSEPIPPGSKLCLLTSENEPDQTLVQLRVRYCVRTQSLSGPYQCGLDAIGTQIDFFGAREGLMIVPSVPAEDERRDRRSNRFVTRTDAAIHDARNYLQVIECAAQMLTDRSVGTHATGRILKAVAQLAHCLQELDDDQKGLYAGEETTVAVDVLVREAIEACRPLTEPHGITVELAPLPPGALVLGRPKSLLRVLQNLLINAKAAVARAPVKWIRVSAEVVGQRVHLRIADSGRLAAADRQRLFSPWFSTKPPDATRATGIGLTFAQAIVAHHGGRIYLADSPITTFVIELPLVAAGERN